MPEVIQDWLGTRLGVVLDLCPKNFGRNTKDGVLLARLLYSYGVIPVEISARVRETRNYRECYANLMQLKPWLEHIGVRQDEASLQEVARGEGSFAISLFYEVYLNLERRDRLYYTSAQKERRVSLEACKRKIKVDWVPEASLRRDSGDACAALSRPLAEAADLIEWHRLRCREVVESIKRVKARYAKAMRRQKAGKLGAVVSKHSTSRLLDRRTLECEETREGIREFERRHLKESPDPTFSELVRQKKALEESGENCFPGPEDAVLILSNMKQRRKREVYARNFQEKMQKMVLDEERGAIERRQCEEFREKVCLNLLKQSHYEKQMTSKLCQLRQRKKIFAENRKLVENLKTSRCDEEFEDLVRYRSEVRGEEEERDAFERERLEELHKRVYLEKVRTRRRMIAQEGRCIVERIVDIAVRISEIRQVTGCQVPKSFMKDLKELFVKNLPIFDVIENYEELLVEGKPLEGEAEGEHDYIPVNESFDKMKDRERLRQDTLNEIDFVDYLELLGPWMVELLLPESGAETESEHRVLGHLVHRLLEMKYPAPSLPVPAAIKPMAPTAIVQNVEGDAWKMLSDVLETRRILLVRVDDAINFILAAYKDELSVVRDITIVFEKLTDRALHEKPEKEKEAKKKVQLQSEHAAAVAAAVVGNEFAFADKETQTPRMIPDDDPLLSADAELGKIAFEALGSGDPVPDGVIVSAISTYVRSKQEDYEGWVLLNYPQFYTQASDLECVLTGYRLMPVDGNTEIYCLEYEEDFTYREQCVSPFERDDFAGKRVSRLVGKPDPEPGLPPEPKTYFGAFIRLKKQGDSSARPSKSEESAAARTVRDFYAGQNVYSVFEYATLNFQTVKNLAKAILENGDKNESEPIRKSSLEVFGSAILELNDKWEGGKKKKDAGKAGEKGTENGGSRGRGKGPAEAIAVEADKPPEEDGGKSTAGPASAAAPGDPNWEWAVGPHPAPLLRSLAEIWENMEAVYVEDLKDVFFCLRAHRSNVLGYCEFMKRSVETVVGQPDEKQKVLGDFQEMFNGIDEDLRSDADIKCELHVRVSELEEALMGIADERRANALGDLRKIGEDGWVADEMASLVNHFLSVVQLESDRCVDTCQILADYYLPFQSRPPEDKPLGKITVSKLQIQDRRYSILSSSSSPPPPQRIGSSATQTFPSKGELRRKTSSLSERGSKTRGWQMEKRRRSSDSSFLAGASEVVTAILTNLALPEDGQTPFHAFFTDSAQSAASEVAAILESCAADARKGDKGGGGKNVKRGPSSSLGLGQGGFQAEWDSALEDEAARFRLRVRLILARGLFEMNEFLATILNCLSAIAEAINEVYMREIRSISECCKVFRCSIEEEIPIRPRLELRGDAFCVNESVSMFAEPEDGKRFSGEEETDDGNEFVFNMDQLRALFGKLQRVAPDGEIIKRAFLFILEDLRTLNSEIGNCFPPSWKSLEPEDVESVLTELYQDLEIVHWKDFIISAMGLPVPTEDEILTMRKRFRGLDSLATELINREDYESVEFWFEAGEDGCTGTRRRHEDARDLLFRMYQVDGTQTNYSALLLAFCKDENPTAGFTKALALVMGKRINAEWPPREFAFPEEEENGSAETGYAYGYSLPAGKPRCCSYESSDARKRCLPPDKIVRCDCGYNMAAGDDDSRGSSSSRERDGGVTSPDTETVWGEASPYYEGCQPTRDSATSIIPLPILTSLLMASFPSLSQLSLLLDCRQTFQETLNSIYDDLGSRDGQVEVYKVIRHRFVSRLVQTTNKFKAVSLGAAVESLLRSKVAECRPECEPAASPSCSGCVD